MCPKPFKMACNGIAVRLMKCKALFFALVTRINPFQNNISSLLNNWNLGRNKKIQVNK